MEPNKRNIEIALVICTYNRDRYLPAALESIKNQTFPSHQFETIIVNNNSTDNTEVIVKDFIRNNPSLNTRYVIEKDKGLSFARNRGLKEATAPVIAYVDDDAILSVNYLLEVNSFFNKHRTAVGAGGRVIPKYEDDKEPEWMNKYLNGFIGRVEFGDEIRKFEKKMKYPAGCNMIYKREVLLQVQGFNNELTFRSDDKDIFLRVKKISDDIYYVPQAWVYHNIDSTRLRYDNFRKLFLKTGNEEKRRVKSEQGSFGLAKKFAEFVVKFIASLILFIIFSLKGHYLKGKYVAASQWYTLRGFLQKKVFVR